MSSISNQDLLPLAAKPVSQVLKPGPEYQRLDVFVGNWQTTGQIYAGPSGTPIPIHGSDTYGWLPGGYFLVHHIDVRIGEESMNGIEIIGYDALHQNYPMHFYDSQGNCGTMRASFNEGTCTFAGCSERFSGKFSKDNNCLAGIWEQLNDQNCWVPWMEIKLIKSQ